MNRKGYRYLSSREINALTAKVLTSSPDDLKYFHATLMAGQSMKGIHASGGPSERILYRKMARWAKELGMKDTTWATLWYTHIIHSRDSGQSWEAMAGRLQISKKRIMRIYANLMIGKKG